LISQDGSDEVPGGVPRRRIGVVESDLERVHTPYTALDGFVRGFPDWRVEVFTDATVSSLAQSASRFDAIVFAENAIDQSDAIAELIRDGGFPAANCLIMPQNKLEPAYLLIEQQFEVSAQKIDHSGARLTIPPGMVAHSEPFLCWPEPVPVEGRKVELERGMPTEWALAIGDIGRWQSIIEIEEDGSSRPVVLRTVEGAEHRTVLCTLRLDPALRAQGALLRNLIAYAAGGMPAVTVVGAAADIGPIVIAGKLRLQGLSAIELATVESDRLPLSQWPAGATRRIVVAEGWDVERAAQREDAAEWLERGGAIVGLGADGRMTYRHGATDAQWVAERWAAWLSGRDPATWLGGRTPEEPPGSIFGARSVLRVLQLLFDPASGAFSGRFGLEPPDAFREAVDRLVQRRLQAGGHIEQTISTTVAAYDLLRLTGSRLDARDDIERWLRSHVGGASTADQLDAARSLRDGDLLDRAASALSAPVRSPLLTARLLQAQVACGRPSTVPFADPEGEELDQSVLLASEYLAAVAAHAVLPGRDRDATCDGAQRAIGTIARWGALRRVGTEPPSSIAGGTAEIVAVCTEAAAMLRYFRLSSVATHTLATPGAATLEPVMRPVLSQLQRSRAALETAERRAAGADAELAALEQALAKGSHVFGALSAIAASATVVAVLLAFDADLATVLSALGAGAVVLVGLALLLDPLRLTPPWLKRWGAWVAGGWKGLLDAARRRFADGG
jgi:hypothetical protein